MTPDLAAALDRAIAETGVARFRWLCSDANTLPPPNSRDDWRAFVLAGRWRQPVPIEGASAPPTIAVHYGASPGPRPCGSC